MFAMYVGPNRRTRKVNTTIRPSVKWRNYSWPLKQRSTIRLADTSDIRFATSPEVIAISYAPNSENTLKLRLTPLNDINQCLNAGRVTLKIIMPNNLGSLRTFDFCTSSISCCFDTFDAHCYTRLACCLRVLEVYRWRYLKRLSGSWKKVAGSAVYSKKVWR